MVASFDIESSYIPGDPTIFGGPYGGKHQRYAVGAVHIGNENRSEVYDEKDIHLFELELHRQNLLICYNGFAYDYNVLAQYMDVSSFKEKTIDVYLEILRKAKVRVSLDAVAAATLGGERKTMLMGSVPLAWRTGAERQTIIHVIQDARLVWKIYEIGALYGEIRYVDEKNHTVGKIDVDWSLTSPAFTEPPPFEAGTDLRLLRRERE